jgi:hypothetical protein
MSNPVTTLVTIPDCKAVHILSTTIEGEDVSQTVSDLGDGDLTLILASSDAIEGPVPGLNAPDPEDIRIICTLSVGRAAFALYQSTLFGTLADEPNAYVFRPEIGGDKGR